MPYFDVAGLTGFSTLTQAGVKDGWFQSEGDIKHPYRESSLAVISSCFEHIAMTSSPW